MLRLTCPLGLAVVLLSMVSGCATVTGGARDPKVEVTSNPPGATVLVDGQPRGVTPAVVELSRKSDHEVVIQQTSYETAVVPIKRRLNPWIFGNVIVSGLIGVVIDVATDSTHSLSTDNIHVNLQNKSAPVA